MKNTDKETFQFTYSAKEQEEIKAIRKKYADPQESEDKMAQLRRLDSGVTRKATVASLAVGVVGALILGFGMSLVMTDMGKIFGLYTHLAMLMGIVIGAVGIVFVSIAYPLYNKVLKQERQRIAPEILRLSEELMK